MINIPIFLSSDNNYAPFVATTIASICDNTKSFCDFYILDGGITQENQKKICELKKQFDNFSIEFIRIDVEKEFKDIYYTNTNEYISLSTYNRFLIPKVKPDLGKILYLDVDIVVLDDLAELYNQDIKPYSLGAIWNKSRKNFNTDTKDLMDLSESYKYFNAGVLVLDIKKWNEENIVQHLFEIEKQYRGKVLHADETLLNKYFDGNYQVLDLKYNYMDYDCVTNQIKDVVIRHFATPTKPWVANYSIVNKAVIPLKNFNSFWQYAKRTVFYDEIKSIYETNINKNLFTQRMSALADKMINKRTLIERKVDNNDN